MLDTGFHLGVQDTEWKRYDFYRPIETRPLFWVIRVEYNGRFKSIQKAIPAACYLALSATAIAHFLRMTQLRFVAVSSERESIRKGILCSSEEQRCWERSASDAVLREVALTGPEPFQAAEAEWGRSFHLAQGASSKIGRNYESALPKFSSEVEKRGALTLVRNWVEHGSTMTVPNSHDMHYLAALAVICTLLEERDIDTQSWKVGDDKFVEHAMYIVADSLIRANMSFDLPGLVP